MENTYQKLTQEFSDLDFKRNYLLANQTYFKVGGPAQVYLEANNHDVIHNLHVFCNANHIKLTIIGGASNVIVDDEGISGLVLKITDDSFKIVETKDKKTIIQVGAGTKTSLLVKQSVDNNLTGLEKFLGVPGSVGGAIYNNAHYLEELIGDKVERVKVSDLEEGLVWLNKNKLDFDYDQSRFQKTDEVILAVEFGLASGDKNLSKKIIQESAQYRAHTQPLGLPSSGCIFQNVPNDEKLKKLFPQFAQRNYISGGFIIDQAGCKGKKVGDIEVSQKHAAFFVNNGQGTAKDVRKLIEQVKETVKEKFGINLKEEVFYLK